MIFNETENNEYTQGIEDWMSIMDFEDKEVVAWCRRNITELKIKRRNLKKEKKHLS